MGTEDCSVMNILCNFMKYFIKYCIRILQGLIFVIRKSYFIQLVQIFHENVRKYFMKYSIEYSYEIACLGTSPLSSGSLLSWKFSFETCIKNVINHISISQTFIFNKVQIKCYCVFLAVQKCKRLSYCQQ